MFGLLIFGLGLTKSSSFSFGLLVSYLFQLSNVIRPKSEGGLLPFDIDERFLSFLARKIFYYPFDVSNIFYHFQSNLLQIRRYLLLALKQKNIQVTEHRVVEFPSSQAIDWMNSHLCSLIKLNLIVFFCW